MDVIKLVDHYAGECYSLCAQCKSTPFRHKHPSPWHGFAKIPRGIHHHTEVVGKLISTSGGYKNGAFYSTVDERCMKQPFCLISVQIHGLTWTSLGNIPRSFQYRRIGQVRNGQKVVECVTNIVHARTKIHLSLYIYNINKLLVTWEWKTSGCF